ncbi:MAG: 30S ribosomal protein S8 [Deltaproteobacteria bacterium]|nr:30S ribosomal protein S8 [Deltaproteobacteria bacterium]
MSMTDPIADLLTRIRNGQQARHEAVELPASKLKVAVVKLLKEEGFIEDYMVLDDRLQGVIRIDLKYVNKIPAIQTIERVSRPGRRIYLGVDDLPRVLGGMGIAIVSTSRGLMTDREARKQRVGGEVLCRVY